MMRIAMRWRAERLGRKDALRGVPSLNSRTLGDAERALLEDVWAANASRFASHHCELRQSRDLAHFALEDLRAANERFCARATRIIDCAGVPRRALSAPLARFALLAIMMCEAVLNFGAAATVFAPQTLRWLGTGPQEVHVDALAVTLLLSVMLPLSAHMFGVTCARGGWTRARVWTWAAIGVLIAIAIGFMSRLRANGAAAQRVMSALSGPSFGQLPTVEEVPILGIDAAPLDAADAMPGQEMWWFVLLGTMLVAFAALVAFYSHDSLEEVTEAQAELERARLAATRRNACVARAEGRAWAHVQTVRARGRLVLSWYRRGHRQTAERYPAYYDEVASDAHDPTTDLEDRWHSFRSRQDGGFTSHTP